jgi:hypothetical protein
MLLKHLGGKPWQDYLVSRGLPSDTNYPISPDVVTLCDKNGAAVNMNHSEVIMRPFFQWDAKGNRGRFKHNTSVTMVLRLEYKWFQEFEAMLDGREASPEPAKPTSAASCSQRSAPSRSQRKLKRAVPDSEFDSVARVSVPTVYCLIL